MIILNTFSVKKQALLFEEEALQEKEVLLDHLDYLTHLLI